MRLLINAERAVTTVAALGEHVLRPPAASGRTAVAADGPTRRRNAGHEAR
jgi:hypothetical protein